jgi:glycosyltransferase involved in cell wall biosynthesis
MAIDLILCTHNPRWDYLVRTLQSISHQRLPEGLAVKPTLVDNNSSADGAEKLQSLCLERGFNYLFEREPGLVHARICGLRSTSADVIVWVDDDTVLAPNFIAEAARIADEKPFLGVWGGNVVLELEKPVPDYIRPHLPLLTETLVEVEEWSNYRDCIPVAGAGMCTRRVVGEQYVRNYEASPARKLLGRSAKNLFSGEDWDFCLTSADMGYGVGRMPQLSLTHLIPERRTTEDYLLKIAYGHRFSAQIVLAIRKRPPISRVSSRQLFAMKLRQMMKPAFAKKIMMAEWNGSNDGAEFVKKNNL